MRAARSGPQSGRGRLQHHAHGRRDRFEPSQLLPGQHPGIQVWQQPGLLQDGDARRPQVAEGGVVAVGVQPLARRRPAILGTITQGEQRFRAARRRASAGDLDDLVQAQVGRGQPVRDGRERAVVAPVPAQPREGDEHLRRIGDRVRTPGRAQARVPYPCRRRGQINEIVLAGGHQHGRLHRVEDHTVAGPPQRAPQRWARRRRLGTGPYRSPGVRRHRRCGVVRRGAGRIVRGLPRSRHLPTRIPMIRYQERRDHAFLAPEPQWRPATPPRPPQRFGWLPSVPEGGPGH